MSFSSNQKKGLTKEKEKTLDLGLNSHPGSGSVWFAKGDMSNDYVLIEHKFTEKKSFSLTLRDLEKVRIQASSRMPVFVISFGKRSYYILGEEDFKALAEAYYGKAKR